MGVELWSLRSNGRINVAYRVALLLEKLGSAAQQDFAVDIQELIGVVGELVADIAQVGGAEQGIADCVYEHIGIGVPCQAILIRDLHTTYPKVAVLDKFMYIYSKTNTYHSIRICLYLTSEQVSEAIHVERERETQSLVERVALRC